MIVAASANSREALTASQMLVTQEAKVESIHLGQDERGKGVELSFWKPVVT